MLEANEMKLWKIRTCLERALLGHLAGIPAEKAIFQPDVKTGTVSKLYEASAIHQELLKSNPMVIPIKLEDFLKKLSKSKRFKVRGEFIEDSLDRDSTVTLYGEEVSHLQEMTLGDLEEALGPPEECESDSDEDETSDENDDPDVHDVTDLL